MVTPELGLSPFGEDLLSGTLEVVGRRSMGERRTEVMLRAPGVPAPFRQSLTLRLAANGRRTKEIASDLGVSVSTVSCDLHEGCDRMGIERHELALLRLPTCTGCEADRSAVCWTPLASQLPGVLSPTESETARALLLGLSNCEIAASRARSVRTVANQIAAVFRRLEISSRAELFAGVWLKEAAPPRCNERISLASGVVHSAP